MLAADSSLSSLRPRIEQLVDRSQHQKSAIIHPCVHSRKAGLFYLVFVMFSYTTGGPFGLEDMVTTSGPGMTLIYLLVLPFFWCIPVSLVSAELTTAMPVEGGFYRWTRAAFGDFWGFLAGWWNWSASFLLGGAYAVLFTDYLVYYFPGITGWKHYLVSVALIAVITWINVRGIQMVGQVATALEIFIFIPVVDDGRDGAAALASQSVCAVGSAASAHVQNLRRGTGAGAVAVFGIRTTLDRGGGSGESATGLSAGAGAGRAAFDCGIFSAHAGRAGFGGSLAELAHRIFLGRGEDRSAGRFWAARGWAPG